MIHSSQLRRLAVAAAFSAAALPLAVPSTAHAWWRGGFFIGVPPVVIGPPVVYPPPVYAAPPVYASPPVYAAPPAYAPPPAYAEQPPGDGYVSRGQACYAARYVCPLDRPVRPGGSCSCPTNTGSRVWGHTG
jgi:hypothetical protein